MIWFMLESTIQTSILKYLKGFPHPRFVWKVSDRFRSGIPDILFIYKGKVIFIEVKQPGKEPTPIQSNTIDTLNKCGVHAF